MSSSPASDSAVSARTASCARRTEIFSSESALRRHYDRCHEVLVEHRRFGTNSVRRMNLMDRKTEIESRLIYD